jgi:hypothetical protein
VIFIAGEESLEKPLLEEKLSLQPRRTRGLKPPCPISKIYA